MVSYALSPGILIQEVVSETVLLDMDKGEYYELNETGSTMLRILKETGDPKQVFRFLLNEYNVSVDEVTRDFHDLVSKLERHGLVKKKGNLGSE